MNKVCLSIIIVSYNTKDITDNCLKSIFNASWKSSFEVIVVDNNSNDGSVEMIHQKYPQVKLIANTDNKFFAIANNQGASIAFGEYLLLLNSDTVVYDDNLQKMIDHFSALPEDVICMGPTVLNADKSFQAASGVIPSISERIIVNFKLYKLLPFLDKIWHGLPIKTTKTRQVGWVPGCSMMMRANLYKKVGGLNENLLFYGEEPEFGYRTWKKYHYKTVYYPEAEIIHLGGISTAKENKIKKTELSTRHDRYIALQEETVGLKNAIRMSYVVLLAAKIKRLLHPNKEYFDNAIEYEKTVITAMKERLKFK